MNCFLFYSPDIQDIGDDKNNYCFYQKINFNNYESYQFIRAPCLSNFFKLPFICSMPQSI